MPAFYETTIRKFVAAPGVLDPVTAFDFTRANSGTFQVQFLRGGVVIELGNGSETGQFVLKPKGQYDAEATVAALAWTKTGSGETALYTFTPSFSGNPALDALLHVDNDVTNDVSPVTLMGAIRFVDGAGVPDETRAFDANVYNNIVRGSETAPASTTAALPVFLPTVTALVSVGATRVLTSDNTNVANGDTVTIGNKTYTFRTALTPTEGEVLIGANADASLLNLIRAINHTGTPNTDYKCAAAHTQVSAGGTVTVHTFSITALTKGTAGNAIATTETSAHLSFGGATLAGGVDGLDGVATVALPLQKLVALVISGGSQFWLLLSGTGTTSPAVVRPLDYNVSTNAKNWIQVSPSAVLYSLDGDPSIGVDERQLLTAGGPNMVWTEDATVFASKKVYIGETIDPVDAQIIFDWDDVSTFKKTVEFGNGAAKIFDDGSIKPAHLADSAATNDSHYFSTTAGKFVYKDAGGTVHALY